MGGIVDIAHFLGLPETARIYILDSHRPINLHNAFASTHTQVVVFFDHTHDDVAAAKQMRHLKAAFENLEVALYLP